jgi:DNA-binding transcriptional LysR family regulator
MPCASFTRIVELGSFSKAAEDMQIPAATATYTIKQLEAHLGVRLLQRTTRHVSTTLDGQAYYERCVRILADGGDRGRFRQQRRRPARQAAGRFARHAGAPLRAAALKEFFARYPGIELEIGMGDRLVDLVRDGVDCVLRVGELRDSSMVARRVASLQQVTCASAAYFEQHGTRSRWTTCDAGHRAVNFFSSATGKLFPFDFRRRRSTQHPPAGQRVGRQRRSLCGLLRQ